MQKIIEIKKSTVCRGQNRIFNEFSLEIIRGCNTAILGPNGAGKSTLLKLLSREIYPVHRDGSYVRILGQELWNVWELREHLGIISHDLQHQYIDDALGIEVVLSGYYSSIGTWRHQHFSSEDKERARHIMNTLQIAELKDRLFSTLSTGEQRRFLLGRALIHDPGILVLDEPTSGLDLKACFQYLDIIRKLMQEGKTVILVTHHINEIPPEISRVVLLKDGEILADGEKDEILTDENLSNLFDAPIKLLSTNGFYQAIPGVD